MLKQKKSKQNKKKEKFVLDGIPASFDCSGAFQLSDTFNLNLASQKQSFSLVFPNPLEKDIVMAAECGKKSGFGKGAQNVVDEYYRMAFQYLPKSLGLPSSLMEKIYTQVTQAVQQSLGLDCGVRAELIKLNIYPVGGLFKKHVDSPKLQAFGSLVVFLPCYFKGGDLVVEKEGSHNFSFGGDKNNSKIHWVAFYNDCVHEITEVVEGWRLTLSFNLFYQSLLQTELYPKQQILNKLGALKEDEVYGYYCEHYYGNNALQKARKNFKKMRFLKGNDQALYVAAKLIGAKKILLKVLFKETLRSDEFDPFVAESDKQQSQPNQQQQQQESIYYEDQIKQQQFEQAEEIVLIGNPQKVSKIQSWVDDQNDQGGEINRIFSKKFKTKRWDSFNEVVWLNSEQQNSSYLYAITGYYGNDYNIGEKYCRLIILIYL